MGAASSSSLSSSAPAAQRPLDAAEAAFPQALEQWLRAQEDARVSSGARLFQRHHVDAYLSLVASLQHDEAVLLGAHQSLGALEVRVVTKAVYLISTQTLVHSRNGTVDRHQRTLRI